MGIQQLNKKQEVNSRELKRQSKDKEVETSEPKSKRKGKTKQKASKKVEKWMWFDKPRNK